MKIKSKRFPSVTRDYARVLVGKLVWKDRLPASECRAELCGDIMLAIAEGRCPEPQITCKFALEHLEEELFVRPDGAERTQGQKKPEKRVNARRKTS